MAPAVLGTPRGPDHEEAPHGQDHTRPRVDRARIMRKVLKEAEDRYRNELLPDQERLLLCDRIKRLRRKLNS